jgi:peroxiredoxin
MPGGRSDDPFDIGTLVLKLATQLKIGHPAPLFEINTLDDQPLKLADFRGKLVLLDFWATWCGPCIQEMPNFKTLYNEFASDQRFVLISLSLDNDPQTAKTYVTDNRLIWIHGFLGRTSKTADDYAVKGIPATFLISPDGNILAKDLRGQQLKAEVAKALKTTPTVSPTPPASGR